MINVTCHNIPINCVAGFFLLNESVDAPEVQINCTLYFKKEPLGPLYPKRVPCPPAINNTANSPFRIAS